MKSISVSVGGGMPLLLFIGGAMLSFLTTPEMQLSTRSLSSLAVGFMTAAGGTIGALGGGMASGLAAGSLHEKGRISRMLASAIITFGMHGGLAFGTYEGYHQTYDHLRENAAQHQTQPETPVSAPPRVS
jgi:hypothetical protein